jgi:iron(III) transport system ATP-binding protein
VAAGTNVRLYLRPEDVVVNGAAVGQGNAAHAKVTKVEFLGAFCHVTVALAGAEEQPLLINISRHSIDEMSLTEGSALHVGLPPECMRLLA